jgi:CRISPR/Cas system CSM-associated protein Csm4 (group 5 of RAMP superfamily)
MCHIAIVKSNYSHTYKTPKDGRIYNKRRIFFNVEEELWILNTFHSDKLNNNNPAYAAIPLINILDL